MPFRTILLRALSYYWPPQYKYPLSNLSRLCLRIVLDRMEKKFFGERFNNPENADKNKELDANILKRVKQVMGMVM